MNRMHYQNKLYNALNSKDLGVITSRQYVQGSLHRNNEFLGNNR
jgi:hypothetical protein